MSEFLDLIPRDFARRHLVLSTGTVPSGAQGAPGVQAGGGGGDGRGGVGGEGAGGIIECLDIAPSTRPHIPLNVATRLGRPVRTRVCDPEQIAAAIDRAYDEHARTIATATVGGGVGGTNGTVASVAEQDRPALTVEGSVDVEADLAQAVQAAEADLLNTEGKAPSVRLVDLILFEALLKDASDVHVQPLRDRTLVRYRLDGALHTARELPASLASSVVSRIKVMARLDVAERRAPQDGRATVTIGGGVGGGPALRAGVALPTARRIDLRISTLPSTYGERVVLRLLDPSRSPYLLSFSALGMPTKVEQAYLAQCSRTSGIVLSTGPTGSGKTTTLYTTLAWINSTNAGASTRGCELNMMTVEDPVEYDLSGSGLAVSQTQVDIKKNLTFATGLRHILRQDPDVIMVGEIRDEETAKIAVQASLTGHLVLSTLHTNDAASAVARLIDLGVEPFLVSSSLAAVLAQRLVRKVHAPCGGNGCPACLYTGFKGRTGVFELLVMDGPLREMVGRHCSAVDIKTAAQRAGMVTLREAGHDLVRAGLTTAAEVARVIEALDEVGGTELGVER